MESTREFCKRRSISPELSEYTSLNLAIYNGFSSEVQESCASLPDGFSHQRTYRGEAGEYVPDGESFSFTTKTEHGGLVRVNMNHK
jgi:hypothetical protein